MHQMIEVLGSWEDKSWVLPAQEQYLSKNENLHYVWKFPSIDNVTSFSDSNLKWVGFSVGLP